jgi:hypothetical protein
LPWALNRETAAIRAPGKLDSATQTFVWSNPSRGGAQSSALDFASPAIEFGRSQWN